MNTQEYRKVYVDVYAVMLRNGTVKPRRFQWEDGAIYQIDRILHITPAASTKGGGRGIRYSADSAMKSFANHNKKKGRYT